MNNFRRVPRVVSWLIVNGQPVWHQSRYCLVCILSPVLFTCSTNIKTWSRQGDVNHWVWLSQIFCISISTEGLMHSVVNFILKYASSVLEGTQAVHLPISVQWEATSVFKNCWLFVVPLLRSQRGMCSIWDGGWNLETVSILGCKTAKSSLILLLTSKIVWGGCKGQLKRPSYSMHWTGNLGWLSLWTLDKQRGKVEPQCHSMKTNLEDSFYFMIWFPKGCPLWQYIKTLLSLWFAYFACVRAEPQALASWGKLSG